MFRLRTYKLFSFENQHYCISRKIISFSLSNTVSLRINPTDESTQSNNYPKKTLPKHQISIGMAHSSRIIRTTQAPNFSQALFSSIPKGNNMIRRPPVQALGFAVASGCAIYITSMMSTKTQNEMGDLERKASSHFDHHCFR